jgi:hypothetical protein
MFSFGCILEITQRFIPIDSEELNQQQGSIPWSEFLQAFSQLGFSGIHARGSSWRFTKHDGRSFTGALSSFTLDFLSPLIIGFPKAHAPHPDSTLNFWQARRLGRRLTRRFDWTGDIFTLQERA